MPSSDIEAFLDKLKEDKDLQAKLTNIEDPQKILAIANDAGFGLTMDESKTIFFASRTLNI